MKTLLMSVLAAAAAATTLPAWSARPANLAGTTWTVQINGASEQLVITSQGGTGTAGGPTCVTVHGTIGSAPLRGWYCRVTGRLHLKHNNMATGATVRTVDAHVSDEVIGQPLYLGGTVWIEDAVFGELGAYNFSGVR
ncbi:hypothetical protein HLB44_23870 [Aquincola sp. S2]|uniref:DUF5666 domain-containing protein n=1 Tax=Pseudaquabacterium terrae TaxID=2732868 RepID=A0ABX2EMY9_9BURK|nr:hypothetical protein [Aquabacterium terrae]NRF70047.1 hypothetical protein [Aquabacterium terrae]